MEYIILWGENTSELEEAVRGHLNDGFKLQGGVSHSTCWYDRGPDDRGFSEGFAQAMVR
jgi:hypothetical protein